MYFEGVLFLLITIEMEEHLQAIGFSLSEQSPFDIYLATTFDIGPTA